MAGFVRPRHGAKRSTSSAMFATHAELDWRQPARQRGLRRHRDDYYARLDAMRTRGDWEGWIDFFLDGVATIADETVTSARELFSLVAEDRTLALDHTGTSVAAMRLLELLPRYPVVTVAFAVKRLGPKRCGPGAPVRPDNRGRSKAL